MAILRNPNRDRWTVLSNEALEDRRLSYEAVGVYAYLLSKPDGWNIMPEEVAKRGGVGRDKLQKIFRQLKLAGYMVSQRPRGADGRVSGEVLILAEASRIPEKASSGAPHREPEKPAPGKSPPLVSTEVKKVNTDLPRKRDEVWDSLLEACGIESSTTATKSERGAWNKATKELKDLGATPGDIQARARQYRARWPNVTITPCALVRRWSECAASIRAITPRDTAPAQPKADEKLDWAISMVRLLDIPSRGPEEHRDAFVDRVTQYANLHRPSVKRPRRHLTVGTRDLAKP